MVTLTLGIAGGPARLLQPRPPRRPIRDAVVGRGPRDRLRPRGSRRRHTLRHRPAVAEPRAHRRTGQWAVAAVGHRDPAARGPSVRGDHQRSGHQAVPSHRNELGQARQHRSLRGIGRPRSGDREEGTLGRSVRAKVPMYAPDSNRVVGEVSVGISTAEVHHQLWSDVRKAASLVGLALIIGIVGSVLLARRWRGLTMGLQPSEMAELIRGQAAVLHGIDEGVLAVDNDWKTRSSTTRRAGSSRSAASRGSRWRKSV